MMLNVVHCHTTTAAETASIRFTFFVLGNAHHHHPHVSVELTTQLMTVFAVCY